MSGECLKKVLIVDDEPHIVRVLMMKMKGAGYKVVTAVNGLDGMDKFVKEKPAVIITDINMPLASGQKLYGSMDKHNGGRPFFVIVVTSEVDSAIRCWANEKDNIIFVEKPFSPRKILSMVDECFVKLRELNAGV